MPRRRLPSMLAKKNFSISFKEEDYQRVMKMINAKMEFAGYKSVSNFFKRALCTRSVTFYTGKPQTRASLSKIAADMDLIDNDLDCVLHKLSKGDYPDFPEDKIRQMKTCLDSFLKNYRGAYKNLLIYGV